MFHVPHLQYFLTQHIKFSHCGPCKEYNGNITIYRDYHISHGQWLRHNTTYGSHYECHINGHITHYINLPLVTAYQYLIGHYRCSDWFDQIIPPSCNGDFTLFRTLMVNSMPDHARQLGRRATNLSPMERFHEAQHTYQFWDIKKMINAS